jgi:F-type H+-transporting ATPase subunit epsilon
MATKKGLPSELDFQLASSSGKHVEVKAKEVYIETDDGDIGVLPGHQPEFYSVSAGYVTCKAETGEEVKKLVYNAFVQIEPEAVRIGAEEIYEPEEVNPEDVEKEASELKEKLGSLSETESEEREKLKKQLQRKEALLRKVR